MSNTEKNRTSRDLNLANASISDINLPEDFYPLCWKDDERMENLFAQFRDKNVNPINYETKMKFWKNLIHEYCKLKASPTISLAELQTAFQRTSKTNQEKKPYCLDTVLAELMTEGSAKTKSQFMEPPLLTWSGWAVHKLVKAPLNWSLNKVKETVIPTAATNGNCDEITEYVLIEVAKAIAERLLAVFNSTNECHAVVCKEDLIKKMTENNAFTLDGMEAALHYLHCHHKLSIQKTQINKQEVILYKFAVTWTGEVENITPLDISIYTLNKMEKSLIKSVDAIEVDINNTDALVRQYVRDKKKQLAKNFLRKKHVLEKNLVKTSNALTTVQTLLLQIDETRQNAKIVEAFKMGTKTLKNALGDKNITIDAVDDALADVKEILETNADIQFALSGAQFNDIINDGISDETLETELMDLLEDDDITQPMQPTAAAKTDPKCSPPNGLSKPNSPTTITNVIDELLEERLNKLKLNNSISFTVGQTDNNPQINVSTSSAQNIGL